MNQKITVKQAEDIIRRSNGQFITVSFIKRTNSQLRTMNCRVGVHKNLNGKRVRTKPGLIRVFDMTKKEYRNINLSGLRNLRAMGREFHII
jgi:hypothetical protein